MAVPALNSHWEKYGCNVCDEYSMLTVAANNKDSKSSFQSYYNNNGYKCPGIPKDDGGLALAQALGLGVGAGNFHFIIKPDKSFVAVKTADAVDKLGLPIHQCDGGTSFKLTVDNGDGDGTYEEGEKVTITADDAPSGKEFDKWTGDVQYLDDANSATTTITIPAKAVKVTATYKDIVVDTYALTVNSGSGDGDHAEGAKVTITADKAPSGKQFDKWTGDVQYLADANSASTTVTMPAKAITVDATYRDKDPIVKKDNYMVISTWESGVGELGSTVTIDSSAKADTVLAVSIALANSDLAQKKYAWAQISGYANGDFKAMKSVEIIYSSNYPVNVVLDQEGLSDKGESYFYKLPAADGEVVKIAIGDFAQPTWVSAKADLDLTKVLSVSFAATREGQTTELELQGLFLDGFEEVTPIISDAKSMDRALSVTKLTTKSLSLHSAESGIYTVALFNVAGKQLISREMSMAAKTSFTFDFNRSLPSGVYVIKVLGEKSSLVTTEVIR